MKITFIRHAQSEYNVGKNFSFNVPLTADGVNSCKTLNGTFDLLILSPLKRAIQTYANSNIKTKKIIISDLFQEIKNQPPNMMDDDTNYETHDNFDKRVLEACEFLKNLNYNNIGVICHHDFIQNITRKLTGKPISLHNLGQYEVVL